MAEAVLAVVAGAGGLAGLAIQLAESVQQLKSFCSLVGGARDDLERIIKELDIIQRALENTRHSPADQGTTSSDVLQSCLVLFEAPMTRINRISGRLQKLAKKKKLIAGIQYALNRPKIVEAKKELEDAINLLQWLYGVYREAMASDGRARQHIQLRDIAAEQSAITRHIQNLPATISTINTTNSTQKSEPHPGVAVDRTFEDVQHVCKPGDAGRHQAPTPRKWHTLSPRISGWRVRQLALTRATSAWTSSLYIATRCYRVHPEASPAVIASASGDLLLLQHLFAMKLASPYDVTSADRSAFSSKLAMVTSSFKIRKHARNSLMTLLEVAVRSSQPEIVRFLASEMPAEDLQIDATNLHETSFSFGSLHEDGYSFGGYWSSTSLSKIVNITEVIAKRLLPASEDEENEQRLNRLAYRSPSERATDWFWKYMEFPESCPEDSMEVVEKQLEPFGLDLTSLCHALTPLDGERAKLIIQRYALARYEERPDAPLLKLLTLEVVKQVLAPLRENPPWNPNCWSTASLLQSFVTGATASSSFGIRRSRENRKQGNLPGLSRPNASTAGGRGRLGPHTLEVLRACFDGVLQDWAALILEAGIPLKAYHSWEVGLFWPLDAPSVCFRGFAYHSDPAGWHFWWRPKEESFSAQFWDALDNPPEPEPAVPGAWIEDDESEPDFIDSMRRGYGASNFLALHQSARGAERPADGKSSPKMDDRAYQSLMVSLATKCGANSITFLKSKKQLFAKAVFSSR